MLCGFLYSRSLCMYPTSHNRTSSGCSSTEHRYSSRVLGVRILPPVQHLNVSTVINAYNSTVDGMNAPGRHGAAGRAIRGDGDGNPPALGAGDNHVRLAGPGRAVARLVERRFGRPEARGSGSLCSTRALQAQMAERPVEARKVPRSTRGKGTRGRFGYG